MKSPVTVKISSTTVWTSAWFIAEVTVIVTLPLTIAKPPPIDLNAAKVAGELITTLPLNTEELANNSSKSVWLSATAVAIAATSSAEAAFAVAASKEATAVSISAKPSAKAASTVWATLVCSELTVPAKAVRSDWTWDKPATCEARAVIWDSMFENWSS